MTRTPVLHAAYYTLAGIRPMSHGDVSPIDLRVRAEACARVGYRGMGLGHADLMANVAHYGVAGMRKIFDDNGIIYFETEPLMGWCDGDDADPLDIPRNRELLEYGGQLGAFHVKAVGAFGESKATAEQMNRNFERLCSAARDLGTRVSIEMVCISNIRDIKTARAVIGDSWKRGGGLTLDIWHFERGHVPFSEIATLPREAITWVELDDGDAEQKGDMLDEQIDHRRLPGTGGFDIKGFLTSLDKAGYTGPYGVEIISEALRAKPLDEVCRLTYQHTLKQFTALGG